MKIHATPGLARITFTTTGFEGAACRLPPAIATGRFQLPRYVLYDQGETSKGTW
jgi:hypothetical protein